MPDLEFIGFKAPKEEIQKFDSKLGKRERSLVLRELLKMFNEGKVQVVITKTIGG